MNQSASRLLLIVVLGGNLACGLFGDLFSRHDPEISKPITEFNARPEALETSYQDLHRVIRDDPGAAAAVALDQLDARDPTARFVALYTLANTATTDEQLDALRRALQSADLSERVLAAEALLVRGEAQAIPVLIVALSSSEALAYSLPQHQAWQYARDLLLQYTLEDFGLTTAADPSAAAAAQPAWQAWWEQANGRIGWYPDEGVYR